MAKVRFFSALFVSLESSLSHREKVSGVNSGDIFSIVRFSVARTVEVAGGGGSSSGNQKDDT
jgi:hypothetical protein